MLRRVDLIKSLFILKKIASKLTDEIRRKGGRLFALSVNA